MKIIIITGAPGAGKSTVARQLVRYSNKPSGFIEIDNLAIIYPWLASANDLKLCASNLQACIENYKKWGAKSLIISGVIVPEGVYDFLNFNELEITLSVYGLVCDESIATLRIINDKERKDKDERLRWLSLSNKLPLIPNIDLIDTSYLKVNDIINIILKKEEW